MSIAGLTLYRLRGRYYSKTLVCDNNPRPLGRNILRDIPTDLAEFQEWKKAKIAFYLEEENRMRQLLRKNPLQDVHDSGLWCYRGGPYREYFLSASFIRWIYAIDLDENVLRVSVFSGPRIAGDGEQYFITQYFRLDNIPRWLFDEHNYSRDATRLGLVRIDPIMLASKETVPAEYWADVLTTPKPDPELLKLYEESSPQPMSPRQQSRAPSTWVSLQQLLLRDYFKYFIKVFQDLSTYERKSYFVFRQMAYAIISIAQGRGCIEFQCHNSRDKFRVPGIDDAAPDWEPPDTDIYWVGKILIVLDEHIQHEQNKRAAVGRAIKYINASQGPSNTTVVLFSIPCVVIANIKRTAHGCEVSHSTTLPLFTAEMESSTFIRKKYRPPGVVALIDLLSSHSPILPPARSRPGNLPAEICQHIFRLADPGTQRVLQLSCRIFRHVALDSPRVGEWTLLKSNKGRRFDAFSSLRGLQPVKFERMEAGIHTGGTGFKVVVRKGCENVVFGIPLFRVERV